MSQKRNLITQVELRDLFDYDPDTGLFWWRKNPIGRKGRSPDDAPAGVIRQGGYRTIGINLVRYYAHRLAWLYMTGNWPEREIDHINGIKHDNRWCNLREATHFQNLQNRGLDSNNTTGYKGVWYNTPNKTYYADIWANGKRRRSGPCRSAFEAHQWYCKMARILHGEFARWE